MKPYQFIDIKIPEAERRNNSFPSLKNIRKLIFENKIRYKKRKQVDQKDLWATISIAGTFDKKP